MLSLKMVKSVLNEYGLKWILNRLLYSMKLKILNTISYSEFIFEKRGEYPNQLNLFQIDNNILKQFLQGLEESEKNRLIKLADDAAKGIIKAFASIDLDYGYPIDWQLNPITGKRCSKETKWYSIPDFEEARGDIKVVWEISRFSHFLTFARAYLLTGDKSYYSAFSTQLELWLVENPYGYGANFKCGQECSLRMVNTLLAYSVFKMDGIATDKDESNVKELVNRCYRKINSNFFYAYKCIRNNHTISELMGMIVGAWCCGDQQQLSKAFKMMDEVIDEQFTKDGGYRQFSFNYQRLALQDLECILSIEHIVKNELSETSKEKIKNASMLMYQCQDKDGDMPNYGSNDGSLVFPVTACEYRDFKGVINTIHTLITGEQLYEHGNHQEELIWFSGGKPFLNYKIRPEKRISSQFPDAGLFTLRNEKAWAMIVFNNYESRPAHMDQLHFDLWIDGVNVLCDGGTYSYASELGHELVDNKSHNTAVFENVSQMNTYGAFLIYDWTKRKRIMCNSNLFEGEMVSKNGYVHRRRIEQEKDSYQIYDTILGGHRKKNTISFHTPCEVYCEGKKAILKWNGKVMCTLRSDVDIVLTESERSLYYLSKDSTTCLLIEGIGDNKTVVKTVITVRKGEPEND